MRRAACLLTPVLILTLASAPLRAASTPPIQVQTFGLELCPQSICGAAIFTGILFGRVGNNHHALGTFIVAVTHQPLPEPEEDPLVALTGGVFELRVGLRKLRGIVGGGTLLANPNNTFTVDATLVFEDGTLASYRGLLDHRVFPPTIVGPVISQ